MHKREEKTDVSFRNSLKPIVFVDDREVNSLVTSYLLELGASVEVKRLAVGDFIASKRIGFERKTDSDFESSIVDGRLFSQARDLAENFENPILCVVGSDFNRLSLKALRGAFLSLAVDFRIPLFFFKNDRGLAEFIFQAAEREQLSPTRELRLRVEKKPLELSEKQQFIIESLPLVGPKTAQNLLKHFGSVEAVFSASQKELERCEGIGEVRAREIRKVISSKYASSKEEDNVQTSLE